MTALFTVMIGLAVALVVTVHRDATKAARRARACLAPRPSPPPRAARSSRLPVRVRCVVGGCGARAVAMVGAPPMAWCSCTGDVVSCTGAAVELAPPPGWRWSSDGPGLVCPHHDSVRMEARP